MITSGRRPELGPVRVVRVLEVRPQADADGRDLVVLDWVGDGTVPVEARHDRDGALPGRGDEVLAVIAGREVVVVMRVTAGPPPP